MTDIRADDAMPLDEEDRLPWLEAVDEDDEREGPSPLKLIAAVVIGLVAIGLVVGGLFWIGGRESSSGAPETIAAPDGDYKVKPDDPGGMKVEGTGETSYAASTGAEPKGTINMDAMPEAPVTKAPASKPAQTPPQAKPAAPAKAVPVAPAGPGGTIQLGAFSSSGGANTAWKALSSRFKYLAPLSHSVIPVSVNGRTLYRLRASGPGAGSACAKLRVAGETCVTV
jgi:hypothetical protein